jgi:transposase
MVRKRPTPEEIVAKLRQVDVLVSTGKSVADAVRSIGTTEVTYYRWCRRLRSSVSRSSRRRTPDCARRCRI